MPTAFEGTFEWVRTVTSSSCFYVKEQIIYHTIDVSQGGVDNQDIVIVTSGTLTEDSGGGWSGGTPQNPYLINGTVTDGSGTAQADEIVRAHNKTTREFITTKTNDAGFYVIDCANFPSGYQNGDIIELTAGLADRVYRATLRAIFSGGSEGLDIMFQLSADGGRSWEDVSVDKEHVFSETGADLRWRAAGVGDVGLYLSEVRVEYDTTQ